MWTVLSNCTLTSNDFIFWILFIFGTKSVYIFWSPKLTNICVEDAILFLGSRKCILNNILNAVKVVKDKYNRIFWQGLFLEKLIFL